MLIGYVRALPGLNASSQRTTLSRSDCQKIFEETPGSFSERDRMLDRLWEGDIVVVARLACLADALSDLLDIGQRLFDREAGLVSKSEPWADTSTPAGASVLRIFNGLTLLGLGPDPVPLPASSTPRLSFDEVKVGRPAKITAKQWEQYGAQVLSGELPVPTAAKLMGCGRATLYRHLATVRAATG